MSTIEISKIACGSLRIPGNLILKGLTDDPKDEIAMPDWAFLIKNKERIVLWDTGLSTNLDDYPPKTQKSMPKFNPTPPAKTLKERLEKHGIQASQVTDVIFSHAHWDHQQPIHDMFPEATAWLGPGTTAHAGKGFPADPDSGMFSQLLDPNSRIGKVRELDLKTDAWTKYPPFAHAFDFFGDGSLMLCHAPGHIVGNMCAVATTTIKGKQQRVCLGGDCGHSMLLVTGEREIGTWKKDGNGEEVSMHDSIPDARETLAKLRQLKSEGVVIALAHDPEFEWDSIIK